MNLLFATKAQRHEGTRRFSLCFLVSLCLCGKLLFLSFVSTAQSDTAKWWHNKVRNIHYLPEGKDFVLANGTMRFNRALYGTHTAFRVEAGDLPEFALYMPGMGGNFKFGLLSGAHSKWLINATNIKSTYRPGSMIYELKDSMLGNGDIQLTILALADAEGMIIKATFTDVPANVQLLWLFGGASGKKFSRDGDIGADPESSFYLKADYCRDNIFKINGNTFSLLYGSGKVLSEEDRYGNKPAGSDTKTPVDEEKNFQKQLIGIVPENNDIHEVDASSQENPSQLFQSRGSSTPAIAGLLKNLNGNYYFFIENPDSRKLNYTYPDLVNVFNAAEAARNKLADRIIVNTPDPFINTLGGALSMAADAIWEEPSYLHGAVAWRMRLNAWRGPYAADALGWHDRARMHFSSYALSQVTSPLTGPVVADTALHLSRQLEKLGTSLFSSGYISRNPGGKIIAHHYDMNLVFIDELLDHFKWTGDIDYVRKMWPLLQRHLAWEKRNFDKDGDGLYDAYAAIWASDALEYSGGGVTHSSAYNYRANKMVAELASLIGEDPAPYKKESDKILQAMNSQLWMPSKGWYAEYKDLLGNKSLHEFPALWTIYHAIDEHAADPFQSYQSLKYIDYNIPHIPVRANGLDKKPLYVLSTSNWMPYEWSLNNVVLAESQHTALAYWQGNRPEEAYKIWESSLIESMYLGASPGNFQQLSYYDAVRGELYRDFADGIGTTARALVEGLFGIKPDALKNRLTLEPGWPGKWDHASISIPDISIDFKRSGTRDEYTIVPNFQAHMQLSMLVRMKSAGIKSVSINGEIVKWKQLEDAMEDPIIEISSKYRNKYKINIEWNGEIIDRGQHLYKRYTTGTPISIQFIHANVQRIFDPQNLLLHPEPGDHRLNAMINALPGNHTAFIQLNQHGFIWWEALNINVKEEIKNGENLHSNVKEKMNAQPVVLPARIDFQKSECIDLSSFFNDRVTQIFRNQYLSPRPNSPTLQLPTQGIGEWTHPLITANIDDAGLRKLAGEKNQFELPSGLPFRTPSASTSLNIIFTSQWDNYPKKVVVPLTGRASHAYLLMAGSTNPMQSRFINGSVVINYTDGTGDTLLLKNPESWWPIEQDYLEDGYAFHSNVPKPVRIHLKTGLISTETDNSKSAYNGKMIDGGAATVLAMKLDPKKILKEITLQAIANDVVIGLMSVTLIRP